MYPFQDANLAVKRGKRDEYVFVRCALNHDSQRPEIEFGSSDSTQATMLWGAEQMALAWNEIIAIGRLLESWQESDVQFDEVWTGNTA